MKDFDVIVIGSGIGGLICTGILASKGLKPLMLEKNKAPGGYLSSFRRNGFIFDSTVDCISGIGSDGLITTVLSSLGVDKEIEFIRIEPIRVSIFPDIEVAVDANVNAYVNRLISFFPSESAGIKSFFNMAERVYNGIQATINMQIYGTFERNKIDPDILKIVNMTYKDFLNEYINDYKLKAILSDRCPFIGLPPSKVAALSMIILIMSYFRLGAYRPIGGFQRLSDVFIEGIKKNGGKVIFGSNVSKILMSGQNCHGVICDNGEEYISRYIVSNADFVSTFSNLLGGEYISIAEDMIKNPGDSTSFFIVYAGVRGEFERHSSIGYFPSYDIDSFFSPDKAFKKSGTIGITVASIEDKFLAPEGCHTVVLHEMVEASGEKMDRSKCMEIVIKKAENIMPDIKNRTVVLDSATPQTLQRYTGNFNGAAFGWKQIPGFRNIKSHGIKNLYIAGHWGDMGGGVLAAAYSGAKAASEILIKEGLSIGI